MFINIYQPKYITYGKIDEEGNIVAPNTSYFSAMNNKNTSNIINPITKICLDNLIKDWEKGSATKRVQKEKTVLQTIKPNSAAENSYKLYEKYLSEDANKFLQRTALTGNPEAIDSFESFILEYIKYSIPRGTNLTFSSFILSTSNSLLNSGLIVKMFNENKFQIDLKNDANYNLFVNTAANNGFMIETNNNGLLILNFSSERVIDISNQNGLTTIKDFYSKYYTKTINLDITLLSTYLTKVYNDFCDKKPYCHKRSNCGTKIVNEVTARQKISFTQLYSKYDFLYWLKIYMYLRAKETSKSWTQDELNTYIFELTNIYNSSIDKGYELGLSYVDKLIGKYPYEMSMAQSSFYYEPRL